MRDFHEQDPSAKLQYMIILPWTKLKNNIYLNYWVRQCKNKVCEVYNFDINPKNDTKYNSMSRNTFNDVYTPYSKY